MLEKGKGNLVVFFTSEGRMGQEIDRLICVASAVMQTFVSDCCGEEEAFDLCLSIYIPSLTYMYCMYMSSGW